MNQEMRFLQEALAGAEELLVWGPGYDPLHAAPMFIRSGADLERAILDARAMQNLAVYLPEWLARHPGKTLAVAVRPCQVASVAALVREQAVDPARIVLALVRCSGRLDMGKVRAACPEAARCTAARVEEAALTLTVDGAERRLALETILQDSCLACSPSPALEAESVAGCRLVRAPGPTAARSGAAGTDPLDAFLALPLEERLAFWEKEMARCIRCYACRSACPLCLCRDHCVAQSRDPHWLTELDSVKDKLLFQVIHTLHLAGRCTGCGECARACPMGIRLDLLRKHMNRILEDLFGFKPGLDPGTVPPLLTFEKEEPRITEQEPAAFADARPGAPGLTPSASSQGKRA